MNKLFLAIMALLLLTNVTFAKGITLGYQTGTDYMKMDEHARDAWIVGALDGIMAESLYSAKEMTKGSWLGNCIEGMDLTQIKAMFEKELKDKPEGWHAPAALILRTKFKSFCEDRIK